MTAPVREPVTGVSVVRGTTASRLFGLSVLVIVVALFFLPMAASANLVQSLTSLFILVLLAASWNALAGYGGLVSVGQQAFIGLGAYGVIYLSKAGVSPYLAMLVAAVIAGLLSIPVSFLVFRFRGGQFAIATWVVAEAAALLIALDPSVGGGTGISLIALNQFEAGDRRAYTYWLALAGMAGFLFALFGLLRTRVGSALQAIRDDEAGAASVGVSVARTKRIVFLLAAFGSAMAGVLTLANTQFIQPSSIFSVRWSALMIFMALVGGLGTIEGPIIGGIILYFLQDAASDAGAAYLIGLGLVAVLFALFLPRGIWGTLEGRTGIRLTPIGHRLVTSAVPAMTSHDGHDKGQG